MVDGWPICRRYRCERAVGSLDGQSRARKERLDCRYRSSPRMDAARPEQARENGQAHQVSRSLGHAPAVRWLGAAQDHLGAPRNRSSRWREAKRCSCRTGASMNMATTKKAPAKRKAKSEAANGVLAVK